MINGHQNLKAIRNAVAIVVVCGALGGCAGARAFGSGTLSPLDDLNLRPKAIPVVLLDAAEEPYGQRSLRTCRGIAGEVFALNEALGPDMDEPPAPVDAGREAAHAAGSLTVGLLIDAATDFVPVRDWVRQLSGAERHGRKVQAAIQAGRMRRAFLKGTGMRMNCAPPAAPSWFQPRRSETEPRHRTAPPLRQQAPQGPPRAPWSRY